MENRRCQTFRAKSSSHLTSIIMTVNRAWNQIPIRLRMCRRRRRCILVLPLYLLLTLIIILALSQLFDPPCKSLSPNDCEFLEQRPSPRVLLDLKNIDFVVTPRRICPLNSDSNKLKKKKILCFIHSARKYFKSRQVIRDTYGSVHEHHGWSFAVIFILGTGHEEQPDIEFQLMHEILTYGDLLIGDFQDTYFNITYKHLLGYKYALENCANSWSYYVKCDDDVSLNIYHVIDFLETSQPSTSQGNLQYYYYCPIMANKKPIRANQSDASSFPKTWYSTYEEYPEDKFPDFCGVSVYLTTMETVRNIYTTALRSMDHFLRLDDVFVTGIIRDIANVQNPKQIITLVNAHIKYMDYEIKFIPEWPNVLGNESRRRILLAAILQSRVPKEVCLIWKKMQEIRGIIAENDKSNQGKGICKDYLKVKWYDWLMIGML